MTTLGSHCTSIGSIMPIFAGGTSSLNAFSWKEPVRAASVANIAALSGLLTIDGVLLADGDRVLVKNQAVGADNGIYIAHAGAWTRAPDFDQDVEVVAGSIIPVTEGATQADTAWILTTDDPITIGVTALTFSAFGTVTPLAGVAPPSITDSTNVTGVSGSAAREDHTHAHGNRSGGTLHAVATGAVAGFMSSADKTTFDAHLNPIDTANPHQVGLTQAYNVDDTVLLNAGQPMHVHDTTPSNGAIEQTLHVGRTNGNLGVGDGVSLVWALHNDAGTLQDAFEIGARWDSATAGSETAAIVFKSRILGFYTESMRFQANGLATQMVAPFQFYISPNSDPTSGLQLYTNAGGDQFVIPIDSAQSFYVGNTTADPSADFNRTTARAFSIVPLGTTITSGTPSEWINWSSTTILNYLNCSIGGLVSATGTFQFNQSGSVFGGGNLFKNAALFTNNPGVAASLGSQYTFVNTATYRADNAALAMSFWRCCLFQTTWDTVNGGTQSYGTVNAGGLINPTVGAGVTITDMRDWEWTAGTFAGTVTNRSHIYFAATSTPAATIFEGIRSALVASANHRFIRHVGTAQSDFGGAIGLGAGATIDVVLSRGAANRLDLASGDDLRLVSGALQFGGTTEQISRSGGVVTYTAATRHTFTTPVQLPSYTVAGVPSANPAGQMAYISNESGGAVPAFSDGANWRRVTDRAIIT